MVLVGAYGLALATSLPRGAGAGSQAGRIRVLGPAAGNRVLTVSLVLRLPGAVALHRFLGASDGSRARRRPVPAPEFGRHYGLSLERIDALRRALSSHGLAVTRIFPQRTELRVNARVTALDSAFAVRLQDRIDASGRRYLAPARGPTLPAWLHGDVVAVTGLDTHPVLVAADVPAGGLTGTSLAKAYDFSSLRAQGIDGTGQTIAVVSFDSYQDGDLLAYERTFGVRGPSVQHVRVAGGTSPGSGQQEVNLDIDTIRSIAPGAQILDYEAQQGAASDADVINQIVADRRARVISTSWGRCDLLLSPAQRIADENALAAARAAGITVFAASGDNGAYDCQAEDLGDRRPSVDWPAASENVVAVGGTRLALRQDGSYLAEYGWEDVLQGSGSGGGLASVTARPSWQRAPGVQNSSSDGQRQVPDVAGPADPSSGMRVFAGGSLHEIGGTSAAAPFWAAAAVLLREYAQRHGAGDLGFLAPLLYRVAAGRGSGSALHEPTRGGNRKYDVAPGWNYVSGLGSPDVAVLAARLVALVGRR